jgi:dynein heavy chain
MTNLAKPPLIFYVVFNGRENISAFQMPMFFRGFAQAGACSSFDEFNRINVKVLSVIAEQFNCIRLRCART